MSGRTIKVVHFLSPELHDRTQTFFREQEQSRTLPPKSLPASLPRGGVFWGFSQPSYLLPHFLFLVFPLTESPDGLLLLENQESNLYSSSWGLGGFPGWVGGACRKSQVASGDQEDLCRVRRGGQWEGPRCLCKGSIALLALSQSNILMEKHLVQYSNNFKYLKIFFSLFLYRENRGNFDFSHWGRCCFDSASTAHSYGSAQSYFAMDSTTNQSSQSGL